MSQPMHKSNLLYLCIIIFSWMSIISCNPSILLGVNGARLAFSITVPGYYGGSGSSLAPASDSRLIDPRTASIKVVLSRESVIFHELTEAVTPGVAQISLADIPLSTTITHVQVSCLDATNLVLASATAEILIDQAISYSLPLVMVPASDAGTLLELGSLAAYSQAESLSAAAGTAVLYRLTTDDAARECAVSLGWTDGTAAFYDAAGRQIGTVGGSPEQWALLDFGAGTPVFIVLTAPVGTAVSAVLTVETAWFVSPTGSGSGGRSDPLDGAGLPATYDASSAPARFILAAGTYPGKFSLLDRRSLYGGFSASYSARDTALNKTEIGGSFSTAATPDYILRADGQNKVVLDGLTVNPAESTENGSTVDYATVRINNSGLRMTDCTVFSPSPELVFSFTASGSVFSALSISGQAVGEPVVISGSSFIGKGLRWNLGGNSGGSYTNNFLINLQVSTADILIVNSVIDGGWSTDTALNNTATETAASINISQAQPWLIGNTIAAPGGVNTINPLYLNAVRCTGAALYGNLVNNFMFALKEYQAVNSETNLIYVLGSTDQLKLLTSNYFSVMYQAGRNSIYNDTVSRAQTIAAANSIMTAAGTASLNDGSVLSSADYATYQTLLNTLLADFDGPLDDRAAYATRDYRLASGAPAALASGGMDLSVTLNVPAGLPAAFTKYLRYDRNGSPRPAGAWSRGAWQ